MVQEGKNVQGYLGTSGSNIRDVDVRDGQRRQVDNSASGTTLTLGQLYHWDNFTTETTSPLAKSPSG